MPQAIVVSAASVAALLVLLFPLRRATSSTTPAAQHASPPTEQRPGSPEEFLSTHDLIDASLDAHSAHRESVLRSLADRLARDPDSARSFSHQLLAADPEDRDGHHLGLIIVLTREGFFEAALSLAQQTSPASHADTLATIFRLAAAQSPETARDLIALLPNTKPDPVFADILQAWARAEPRQVAEFALTLPHDDRRALALSSATDSWLQRDPAHAAEWIDRLENPVERDAALCRWLLKTDGLHRPTTAALQQALTIMDEKLRLEATTHLLREWATGDSASARRFVEATPGFTPEQRASLFAALIPLPTDCPSPP